MTNEHDRSPFGPIKSETFSDGETVRGVPVWRDSATGDVVPYGPIEVAAKEACAGTTREEGMVRGLELLARELDKLSRRIDDLRRQADIDIMS